MLKRKSLIVAALAASTAGVTALSGQAYANDNAILGAVIGAGIGAAIGHGVQGHNGAVVGGALGAIAGASIAASSNGYYDSGYYAAPAPVYAPTPVYYGEVPAYYPPAQVYYPRPRIGYAPRVNYVRYNGAHPIAHRENHDRGHPGQHGNDVHHGR